MAPRAGLQRNAGDGERGPAQLLACKKAAARPLARRALLEIEGQPVLARLGAVVAVERIRVQAWRADTTTQYQTVARSTVV